MYVSPLLNQTNSQLLYGLQAGRTDVAKNNQARFSGQLAPLRYDEDLLDLSDADPEDGLRTAEATREAEVNKAYQNLSSVSNGLMYGLITSGLALIGLARLAK